MSDRCFKCFKPMNSCLCKYTQEIDCGIKFVFLMHPKEAKRQRTGTGNLSHITLKDSEIIVITLASETTRYEMNKKSFEKVLTTIKFK